MKTLILVLIFFLRRISFQHFIAVEKLWEWDKTVLKRRITLSLYLNSTLCIMKPWPETAACHIR